ncbi:3-deoxy-manno-octulosonate-8-phosphatase KdsC [Opitutales bacterium ASA1]|uniref:KdsC family phosphatase n=1 Tax=Congregicoccus parvus TaxID=3081749 RepID=UPI002B2B18F1|nr:3-deoxy-manno-octulosonate-8-phosphatase KdsC [Opitutales bacterium ASA1]
MNPHTSKPPLDPARWAHIRLFAMDVDGILTDGTVYISSDGTESKAFSVLDGLGIARVRDAGIALAWISGRYSGATTRRAEELAIRHLVQGRKDKENALRDLATHLGLSADQVCYMGDDDIDAPALRWAAIGVSVPTAMPEALEAADYVTTLPAGRGAVREICNHLLRTRSASAVS